jgi:S1-C subfamily serine protease
MKGWSATGQSPTLPLNLNPLDLVIILFAVILVIRGARTGFLSGAFSLAGVALGAIVGSRLAPVLLSESEDPLFRAAITLACILAFAVLGDALARSAGGALRSRLTGPATSTADGAGGAALGLALSMVLVWVGGIFALQMPPLASLQPSIEGSQILQSLNQRMPSQMMGRAVAQFDPLPELQAPAADVPEPESGIASDPQVLRAAKSTVRVTGVACGYGVGGSGWVAAPETVVTNAHVVAGESVTRVQVGGSGRSLPAEVRLFDRRNDVAILHVEGLEARPLQTAAPRPGGSAAVIGFPENGPLDVQPGRTGDTRRVLSGNAYNQGPVEREVTSFLVNVRSGNSGGPAVNGNGQVVSTIFASRADSGESGYGIPPSIVNQRLQTAQARSEPVSTGPCAA